MTRLRAGRFPGKPNRGRGVPGWMGHCIPGAHKPYSLAISADTVAEDAAIGTTVGTFSASDPQGDDLTFSLVDDAGGAFSIDGTALKVAGALSATENPTMAVTIRVTDTQGNELDAVVTITVTAAEGGGGDTPAWLPAEAVAYADFVRGHYYAGGVETTLGATVTDGTTDADGLVLDPAGTVPYLSAGDFLSTMLVDGTFVFSFTPLGRPADIGGLMLCINNDDDSVEVPFIITNDYTSAQFNVTVGTYTEQGISAPIDDGPARVAFTKSGDNLSYSVNGGTVGTAAGASDPVTRVIFGAFGYGDGWNPYPGRVADLTAYPIKPDADLPALSALS